MCPIQYLNAALRTAQTDKFNDDKLLLNAVLGLNGEIGELSSLFVSTPDNVFALNGVDMDEFKNELGDIAWYIALAAHVTNNPFFAYDGDVDDVRDLMEELDNPQRFIFGLSFCTALSAAAGGLTDMVKKRIFQGHDMDESAFADYLLAVQNAFDAAVGFAGVTREEIFNANIEKLWERYPDGFDAERSIHRTAVVDTPHG